MHDRYGNPISLGDAVVVRGTVHELYTDDSNAYCNVTVKCDVGMAGAPYTVVLNAKQIELATPPQPAEPDPV